MIDYHTILIEELIQHEQLMREAFAEPVEKRRLKAEQLLADGKQPGCSTGIHQRITRGYGMLDSNGFWQYPLPDGDPVWDPGDRVFLIAQPQFTGTVRERVPLEAAKASGSLDVYIDWDEPQVPDQRAYKPTELEWHWFSKGRDKK